MSSTRSSRLLLWVIEYLASLPQVPISIVHDLMERLPEFPHDGYGKNAREMVSLKCLEGLFGPSNGITTEVLPELRIGFDYSETCEDVLQSILKEISPPEHGNAGHERLKRDIQFFVMHKRASMDKCTLEKLDDLTGGNNHLDASVLKKKSGLMQVDESNRKNDHLSNLGAVSGMCNLRGLDPHGIAIDGDLVHLKNKDNELQYGMPNEFLLSTKRPKNDLDAGNSGVLVNDHGDMSDYDYCHPYVKKLRLDAAAVGFSGRQTSIDLHANRTLGDSENVLVVSEVEGCFLAQECQSKDNSDEVIAAGILKQRNKYQVVEFPGNETVTFPSDINPCEGTNPRGSQVDVAGNLEPIATPHKLMTDMKDGFSDESPESNDQNIHIKSLDPLSAGKAQEVFPRETSGGPEDPFDGERLSPGDEFEKDYFNLALKKESFLNSHCKSNQNLSGKENWTGKKLCVKCNSNGDTLLCSSNNCRSVFHQCCLPSTPSFNGKGHFYCPFCAYSSSISEYLAAKKKVSSGRKELANFIGMGFGSSTNELNEEPEKELSHSSPTVKGNHPSRTNVNEYFGDDEQNGMNQTSLLQKVAEDNLQLRSFSMGSEHDFITRHGEQEKMTMVQGNEKVVHKCASVAEAKVIQDKILPDHMHDNVHPSVSNETIVHNQGEIEGRVSAQNLSPDSNSSKKPVNSETFIQNKGKVEGRIYEQNLFPNSNQSSEKPVCSVNNEGDEISDSDTNNFIVSHYSIRSRARKQQYTYPATPQLRRNKIRWTTEEEEILKKGVQMFVGARGGTIPWKKIFEFGAHVFLDGRTTIDLKDKWRNLCKASASPRTK